MNLFPDVTYLGEENNLNKKKFVIRFLIVSALEKNSLYSKIYIKI